MRTFTIPKNLLLLDCFGALATSLTTGLILTTVLPTGLPTWILCALSIAAAGFVTFDFVAYRYWPEKRWPLAVIGLLNLSYCTVSISLVVLFMHVMTTIGILYFVGECTIIIPLAVFELMVANTNRWQACSSGKMNKWMNRR